MIHIQDVIYKSLNINDKVSFFVGVRNDIEDPICTSIIQDTFQFPLPYLFFFDNVRPGQRVLDLGGHVGTFSLAACALGCEVITVEALLENAYLINHSALYNDFKKIQVVHAAISNESSILNFLGSGPFGIASNTHLPNHIGIQQLVPSITVDMLLEAVGWDYVDFIKMDVEGSEVKAVQGMSSLLSQPNAPIVIYEANNSTLGMFGANSTRLKKVFSQFGYRNFMLDTPRLVTVNDDDWQAATNVDYVAIKDHREENLKWYISGFFTYEDIIAQILAEAELDVVTHRTTLGSALDDANKTILEDPRVIRAIFKYNIPVRNLPLVNDDIVRFAFNEQINAESTGWSYPETDGAWMTQNKATLKLNLAKDRDYELILYIINSISEEVLASLNIEVNNHNINLELLNSERVKYKAIIPSRVITDTGEMVLSFEVIQTLSPKHLGINEDDRQLGVKVGWLTLIPIPN